MLNLKTGTLLTGAVAIVMASVVPAMAATSWAENVVARLDTDGNKKIDRTEFQKFFDYFPSDQKINEYIRSYMPKACSNEQFITRKLKADDIFNKADKDNNKSISAEEIDTYSDNILEEGFTKYDGDKNGSISLAEYKVYLEDIYVQGWKAKSSKCQTAIDVYAEDYKEYNEGWSKVSFQYMDGNGDNKLNRYEFIGK